MALPSMTLAELRTAAQQRADMVNSQFVADAEWTGYINGSLFELYDLLVQAYGNDYFATSADETTTGTTDTVPLPADFYKLLGVDLQINSAEWLTLRRFNFAERNDAGPNTRAAVHRTNLRYRPNGNNLLFSPRPAGGQTIRIWYVPRLTPLADEADTTDGVSGWLEYVIVDAAIKAMQKEESDVGVLMAQKAALKVRIESASENRDAGSPMTVTDVYASRRLYDDEWGGF